MKDFRVVARIYNNQLRERREATGLSACAFAASIGVNPSTYCALESLKESPLCRKHKRKTWKPCVTKIATALGVEASTLFPDAVQEIRSTLAERRMNAEEMAVALAAPPDASPFGLLTAGEERAAVGAALDSLPERTRKVIAMRFGLDGYEEHTLAAIGEEFKLSKDRIRQIEGQGLRAIRGSRVLDAIAEGLAP